MQASLHIFDSGELAAQTGGDIALQHEIFMLFIRQSTEILDLLRDDSALPRLRADLAHKLKGSALAVGARQLADAAEILESRLRAGHLADEALTNLAASLAAAHQEIGRYLDHSPEGR